MKLFAAIWPENGGSVISLEQIEHKIILSRFLSYLQREICLVNYYVFGFHLDHFSVLL